MTETWSVMYQLDQSIGEYVSALSFCFSIKMILALVRWQILGWVKSFAIFCECEAQFGSSGCFCQCHEGD